MAVQKLYRAAGLTMAVAEAPDHIALELEFMHFLCMGEVDAATDEATAFAAMQSHFLHTCLAPWVPEFCAAIRKGTTCGLYLALADCLEGFISPLAERYRTADIMRTTEGTHACGTAV